MPEPILCRECDHSIDGHGESLTCLDCWHEGVAAVDACRRRPSDIARAYADERVRKASHD